MAIKIQSTTVIDDSRKGILSSLEIDGTSHIKLPVGTAAQRPSSLEVGQMRYNVEGASIEVYDGNQWVLISAIADDALTFALMGLY